MNTKIKCFSKIIIHASIYFHNALFYRRQLTYFYHQYVWTVAFKTALLQRERRSKKKFNKIAIYLPTYVGSIIKNFKMLIKVGPNLGSHILDLEWCQTYQIFDEEHLVLLDPWFRSCAPLVCVDQGVVTLASIE